jgi:Na+(H+)/acetate symporter ActP
MQAFDTLLLPAAGAFLIVLVAIAVMARSSDGSSHAAGGGAMTAVGGGLAIAGVFAIPLTVVLPGIIHKHGFDALIPLSGLAGGLFLLLVLVGPALARSGAVSLPELIGDRFGRVARAIALLVAFVVTAALLFAAFSLLISLAAPLFGVTVGSAAIALAATVVLLVLPGGMRSVLAGSRVVAVLTGLALFGVLAVACAALLGNPIAPLAYGEALRSAGLAEMSLIESGAVDFGVFKPFLREFLNVDRLNWALLTLSLMAAIAALPPLVQLSGAFAPQNARRGLAWALTFVVIALTAAPALATLGRLETYRAVVSGQDFANLPQWLRRASELDAVRLHGTSLGLVDTVARDVAAGATSIDAISATMADRGARAEAIWQRLDPSVQEAVLDLGRSFQLVPGQQLQARWPPYVGTVVAAGAAAAGSTAGKPDLASIEIDPHFLFLGLLHAAGFPGIVSAIVIAILTGGAAILTAVLLTTLSSMLVSDGAATLIGRSPSNRAAVSLMGVFAVIIAVAFAFAAAIVPVAPGVVAVVSLALAAASLLPALILALWVPRATGLGAIAALLSGLALAAYYFAGTAIFSVSFYEAWPGLSSAGPEAYTEYLEAREIWLAAEGDDRAAAFSDLAARTSGSLWSPGLANWFGIAPAAAPVLAIPAALLIGLLVSLLSGWVTRARSHPASDPAGRRANP